MSTVTKNSKKNKNYICEFDQNRDNQARERLVKARIQLLLKQPFFGNIAMRLKLVNADTWCETAGTDGRSFYYNSKFVTDLDPKEVVFLVGHEVLHVVYDHVEPDGRIGNRHPVLWNIACDYAINGDLVKHKIGRLITTVDALYEQKYVGKASEEIYDDLAKKFKTPQSIDQLAEMLLDQHLSESGSGPKGAGDKDNGKPGGGGGPDEMSPQEKEELRNEIKQAIINAYEQSQAQAGSVPLGVDRLVKQLTEYIMPWRDLIQTSLTASVKSDYSWMRTSRRSWHMDAVMPGMTPGEEIDVVVFVDMSGSISNTQGMQFLSEVAGMMDLFDQYRIRIACFDTKVYNFEEFTSDNMERIEEYKLAGGGGTDFDCIFDYLKNNDICPTKLIVFTDGYPCGSWGDENYCDTVWIIHGDPNPNPPFGQWAIYADHRNGN